MKELKDGTQVSARSYYYLLDFNDRDSWRTLVDEFGVTKLHDLNLEQYIRLFEIATEKELKTLKSK